MPSAAINGQDIHYEDTGGNGRPVLFSHGFLMDHEMFEPQLAALSPEFRCITWDERGFGATPADGPFTYWDLAADAVALLDHLDIESAVFAGMSQGGFISLRAALAAPARVKALVLIDTQSGTEAEEALPLYKGMHDDWIVNGPHEALAGAIASLIFGGAYDPGPWIAKWQARDKSLLTLPFECLTTRDDVTARLGEISAPVIIFHGEEDAAIPIAKAEELASGLGNCVDLVRIAGAGHAGNLSHPEAVNGPLVEFLRKYA
jgi:pimeloyl-ACP methyl ester carboxylesterase